jgi:methionyl-tRNA synthetase
MKIQKAAQKAGVDTKLFCDQNMRHFEALWECADISYDHFIRTTDDNHKAAVEHFWTELNRCGYIYESKHEGWYSVSDETFFPQSAVHLVLDPSTGRKHMASMETGREVEWTSEINYHFRLSQFRDRLLQHYRQNPKFIVPSDRMKFIEKEVENGLNDLSISRPVSRLQWGIRVPNDDSQTIYVWLDALINYLTYTGYPGVPWTPTNSLWPPNVQVIGKDIIKFHCIYWPAFLMALDLPLPKQFLTHAFWTMNREKMSKSLGNVVSPFLAVDRFGTDTMRFYMAHDGGIQDDASYENAYIIDRYKTILQGGFGNLASRIVKSKLWNVRASVLSAVRMKFDDSDVSGQGQTLRELITQTPIVAAQQMEQLNPRAALQTIMQVTYMVRTNLFMAASAKFVADKQVPAALGGVGSCPSGKSH